MPFPSHRCRTCRARRVKCSETYPICEQCRRVRRTCLWDDDSLDAFPFRSENEFASGETERRRKPHIRTGKQDKARLTPALGPRIASARRRSSPGAVKLQAAGPSLQTTPKAQLSKWVDIPLELQALNFYLRCYVSNSTTLGEGRVSVDFHLLACLAEARPSSLLDHAASAIALASFGRRFQVSQAIAQSHHRCADALEAVKTTILDSQKSRSNELLVSIWLLIGYENLVLNPQLVGEGKGLSIAQVYSHHDGARAILLHRHRSGLCNDSEKSLNRFIRQMMIRAAIQQGVPVPDWMKDGKEFGEQGLDLQLDQCYVEVAGLRASARKTICHAQQMLYTDTAVMFDDLMDLIREAVRVDNYFMDWEESLPSGWSFSDMDMADSKKPATATNDPERATTYDGTAHMYHSHYHAMMWNLQRVGRLICHAIVCRAAWLCKQHGLAMGLAEATFISRSITTMTRLMAEICASIPFFLAPVAHDSQLTGVLDIRSDREDPVLTDTSPRVTAPIAFQLVMPLVVSLAVCRDPVQLKWLRSRLKIVSHITGSGVLKILARMESL